MNAIDRWHRAALPGAAGVIVLACSPMVPDPALLLRPLAGRSVLSRTIERARAVEGAAVVGCLVAEGRAGDAIAGEAAASGAEPVRAPAGDVVPDVLAAARALSLAIVGLLPAHAPLVDPSVCAAVLRLLRETGADLAANDFAPGWPRGLECEALTVAWLERAAGDASALADRPAMTPDVRPDADAHWAHLPMPGGNAGGLRLTVETDADLPVLAGLIRRLPAGRAGWSHRQVVRHAADLPALWSGGTPKPKAARRWPADGRAFRQN